MELNVGEHVFLKVTPMMTVGRSMKSRKLRILDRYGTTAYRVALPPSLVNIHDVFHVSQLRKYIQNPTHVIEYENMHLQDNLTYKLKLDKIIGTRIKRLLHKQIPLVKVVGR